MQPSHLVPLLLLAALCAGTTGTPLAAQSRAESIRGRVVNDSGRAIPEARVVVTRGPDRRQAVATTDTTGRYRVDFAEGTGDYLVAVSAPTYRPIRRRVQRDAIGGDLIVDVVLAPDLTALQAVRVRAPAPVRPQAFGRDGDPEVGAAEGWLSGFNGRIAPTDAGQLSAWSGTSPLVTETPDGSMVLGAGSASNLVTLNGMPLAAGALPRAASVGGRTTAATFDATRGGFSGLNLDLRLAPGNPNFATRTVTTTVLPSGRLFTPLAQRAAGEVSPAFNVSLGADGATAGDRLAYSVAADVRRRTRARGALDLGVDALAQLGLRGVAADSLLAFAFPRNLLDPARATERPLSQWTALGRFDWLRDPYRTRTLVLSVAGVDEPRSGGGLAHAWSTQRAAQTWSGQAQWTAGGWYGPRRMTRLDHRLSTSVIGQATTPLTDDPLLGVLLSQDADARGAASGRVWLGGAGRLERSRLTTVDASSTAMWNVFGDRHRFRAQVTGRVDRLGLQHGPQQTLLFPSATAFAAGRASSLMGTPGRTLPMLTTWNGAMAFSHQFDPRNQLRPQQMPSRLLILYGVRIEASGASGLADAARFGDPIIERPRAPSTLTVLALPRLGFTWTYSKRPANFGGSSSGTFGNFQNGSLGFVRGGVGLFRDLVLPGALSRVQLRDGDQSPLLTCTGSAAPGIDWARGGPSTATLASCSSPDPVLGIRAPSLAYLSRDFDAPRAWRAALGWSAQFGTWQVDVDGLASWMPNVSGIVDRNLARVPATTLPDESERPLFVSRDAIDAGSGTVSAGSGRRSVRFADVFEQRADLHGRGAQLTIGLTPLLFRRASARWFTAVSYTLAHSARQFRGFDGLPSLEPTGVRWAPSADDVRHRVLVQLGRQSSRFGTLTVFARAQSGTPYFPRIAADVNGDGLSNDAPVVSPRALGAETARAFAQLQASVAPRVRQCLTPDVRGALGTTACRTAWTVSGNGQWRVPAWTVRERSIRATVTLDNPLAAVDVMLHGSSGVRGWGAGGAPDAALLVPTAFDARTARYTYRLNPLFGDENAQRGTSRQPAMLSVDVAMDLSTPFTVQTLRRATAPQSAHGRRVPASADSILARYLRTTSSVIRVVLAFSDSLFLTSAQAGRLIQQDSLYSARVHDVYRPLAERLARLTPRDIDRRVRDEANVVVDRYRTLWWEQAAAIEAVLTPSQFSLLGFLDELRRADPRQRRPEQFGFGPGFDVPYPYRRPRLGLF